ncbi:MAG: CSLREA domain-containing protein [Holophagales bacterium]|nr:CSLREA domain-containing protein [Holophagales bacterium]
MTRTTIALCILGSFALALPLGAVLVPNTFVDENGENAGACSFREAIRAINDNAAFGGCPAPTDGIVQLGAGSFLITLDDCVRISRDANVQGAGAGVTFIQGSGGVVEDLVCAEINDPATLTIRIEDLTVTGGQRRAVETFGGGSNLIDLTIEDVVFEGNVSDISGAALRIQGTEPTDLRLERVVFRDNVVTTPNFAIGGAISCESESADDPVNVTMVDVHFDDNHIVLGGGGGGAPQGEDTGGAGAHVYGEGCQLSISRATFQGGTVDAGFDFSAGGAIALTGYFGTTATVTMENVTFANNSALTGGAIFSSDISNGGVDLSLANLTFSGNVAGAGDHLYLDGATTTEAVNVLFGPGGGGGAADCAGNPGVNLTSLGGNIDADNTCNLTAASDQTGVAAPGLDPLADNGGFAPTQALQPGSVAIDTGVDPCPATDERTEPRPSDGDNNGSALCDVGAYERQGAPAPVVTIQEIPALSGFGLVALALILALAGIAAARHRRSRA